MDSGSKGRFTCAVEKMFACSSVETRRRKSTEKHEAMTHVQVEQIAGMFSSSMVYRAYRTEKWDLMYKGESITVRPDAQIVATESSGWYVLAVLSLLMGFASISTDLYLPAMPAMGRALGADAGLIELTISGYLIGFSLGQLLWGPISDRYGRRPLVSAGLFFFVLGSGGCAVAGSAYALIGWRIVQAIGACARLSKFRSNHITIPRFLDFTND